MLQRIFAIAILMTIVSSVVGAQTQAQSVNTTGLSAEQVATLNNLTEQLRKHPENTLANLSLQTATPDRVKEWTEAGEAAGKAVAAFTKEIGIAADQFLKTDVGRTAFYVGVWKLGGNKVIESFLQIFLSFLTAAVVVFIWWKFTRRFAFFERRVGTVTYNENTLLRWLGFNKKEVKWEKDDGWITEIQDPDLRFWAVLLVRLLCGSVLILILGYGWPTVSF